jgi:hypothetical protein
MKRLGDHFDFTRRGKGHRSYDWATWLDGTVYELERGVDFDVLPESMRSAVHYAALSRGLTVKTKVQGDNIVVQAVLGRAFVPCGSSAACGPAGCPECQP